jgi:DNA-binding winged helix-turn-helix (wHTH) protein
MAGRRAQGPFACAASSRSKQATCEKSGRTSPTAVTIATPITAKARSCFSKNRQGHHERLTAEQAGAFGQNRMNNVSEGKDIAMRAYNTSREIPHRVDSEFVGTDSRTSESRSASIHLLNSSTRHAQHRSAVRSMRTPPALQNEMAEFLADIDGIPILVRFLVTDMSAKMKSDCVSKGADIHSLLTSTLEKMVDRMRGSSQRSDDLLKQPLAIVEITSREPLVRLPAPPNETVLRVGPLELDLLDRTAKRGDRQIDLRPREFRLLKYMMQRNDELLTRATLLKEVWNYKFVPETNLVDVHMGRLRRKVDGPNEAAIIRNVRGVGFILSAASFPQASTRGVSEVLPN